MYALVSAVAEDAEAVNVDAVGDDDGLTLIVRVAPGDMGRVIGKKGRVASAIRTLVRAAAEPGADINVEIDEEE